MIVTSTKSDNYEALIARKVKLRRIISDLSEALQGSFLHPHAAMELAGRRCNAKSELAGVETAIAKELEVRA